jgi:peptidoglycan/xylan/chitin deacetylase (PgdA/CDA1 family)
MGPAQAADWDCFSPGTDGKVLTPAECGALYIKEIEAVGRGIVLMHDPEFIDDTPAKGGTVDMVKAMVPLLKQKGFTFARLEDVPDVAAKLPR